MANLNTLKKNDEYYTPLEAWRNILDYLLTDKVYLEPFYGDGSGVDNLRTLGLEVVSEDVDFNEAIDNFNYDLIITNPPFSTNIFKSFLKKLYEIDKPFIIIIPISKITTKYFQNYFKNKIQIIIPSSRINFNSKDQDRRKSNPSFASIYVAYKMELENDITWL